MSGRNNGPTPLVSMLFGPPAYAAEQDQPAIKKYRYEEPTFTNQFYQGLTGKVVDQNRFVIVGSHLDREEELKQAENINKAYDSITASVFAPDKNAYYAVVIGEHLSLPEALKLKEKAKEIGIAKDAYIKTLRKE